MKKTLLVLLAVGAFALTSCKKNYTCSCTTKDTSNSSDPGITVTATAKLKKKDAKTWCENGTSTVGTIQTTCTLQ
ncbi:MAG: hypothetical protein HY063_08950 [Bacteroidetes bacterium]|nr:hypothetical protein [Bacteroidota bacterium]